MNILTVLIIVAALFLGMTQNDDSGLSLDSLCIFKESLCHKKKDEFKSPPDLDGFYCLSGPDFKKIVEKLKRVENK